MSVVKIGDRDVTIPRFSAFKIVYAGEIVAAIARKYPAIMLDLAKFTREYEKENSVRITRAMAKTPRFQDYGFGSKDFEPDGFVELPQSPTIYEQVFAVFPQIMEAARADVVTLVALILAPNSELADEDENGTVDDYLKGKSRRLLHEAEADQLVDVVVATSELLREQFAHKMGDAGNALALLTGTAPSDNAKTPTDNSPESSSDSPTASDGTDEQSSTALAGKS